jgi:hypothetical protein
MPSPQAQFALLIRAAQLGNMHTGMRARPVIHPCAPLFRHTRAANIGGPIRQCLPSRDCNCSRRVRRGWGIWIPGQSAELLPGGVFTRPSLESLILPNPRHRAPRTPRSRRRLSEPPWERKTSCSRRCAFGVDLGTALKLVEPAGFIRAQCGQQIHAEFLADVKSPSRFRQPLRPGPPIV